MSGNYPPLTAQIAELKRERSNRDRTHPTLILRGQMTEHEANFYMAHLDAAIRTLEWLLKHEKTIKAALGKEGGT